MGKLVKFPQPPSVGEVLESVLDACEKDEVDVIYVVGLSTNHKTQVWGSGNLSDLCFAVKCLDDVAGSYVRGEIGTDYGPKKK